MWLSRSGIVRTTVALDDVLLEKAKKYTGITETTALLREALKSLVQKEAANRLRLLGGTMPDFPDIPRRRLEPEDAE
jgi:Arc/MetJ family transcription regulator